MFVFGVENSFLETPSNPQECLCDDRRFRALVWSRCGVDPQIDCQLDLVTAIVARPEMTDFVVADVRR
jgi:hypothetical protein